MINKNEPSEAFAKTYFEEAKDFFNQVLDVRKEQLETEGGDKLVVDQY